MKRGFLLPLVLGLGLSLLLASASCSDVCPSGQTSCGDENAAAGAAGSSSAVTCPLLTARNDCVKSFCASASNPFCSCYLQKPIPKMLDLTTCTCVKDTFSPAEYCRNAEVLGLDAGSFDCAAETDGVKTACIGVF